MKKAILEGRVSHFLYEMRVRPGKFISVPGGTVHVRPGGLPGAKIQQNGDTTYRIYNRIEPMHPAKSGSFT